MQPYQEEYIANIKEIAALSAHVAADGLSFSDYETQLRNREELVEQKSRRNMELLTHGLFPVLDDLFEAGEEECRELDSFASQLRANGDDGLFRLIHQALLSLARQKGDRSAMIRELYWLGMGHHDLCSKLVGLELEAVEKYVSQMRLCFAEAAAHLKYYDEIDDTEIRSYILRSQANMSLGPFKTPGNKIRIVRDTLRIMQDESYREKAPDLPWDRYLYMTHQQMASSISYNKDHVMSPEDMTSILESAYIVYQRRMKELEEEGRPSLRWTFPYYSIEYFCGLYDLNRLLKKVEGMLNAADMTDHSQEGIYGILSLPAYYCQYLVQAPDKIWGREAYIDGLYRRALEYVRGLSAAEDEKVFICLRHLCFMFIESEGGMPYSEFLQTLMKRFMPGEYLHARMVGEAARSLCELIWEEEPSYFDDIPEIAILMDPEKKRRQILETAMDSGLLHDVGKLSVLELYSRTARQWTEEEYEVTCLHTIAGGVLLGERASTRRFAAAALGHHAWYDGSAHGYPATYKRLECPSRQMVDVVGLLDWLENAIHSARVHTGIEMRFDEAVEAAINLEGRRFSPLLTARLRDRRVTERIQLAFERGRREAYRQMYIQELTGTEK